MASSAKPFYKGTPKARAAQRLASDKSRPSIIDKADLSDLPGFKREPITLTDVEELKDNLRATPQLWVPSIIQQDKNKFVIDWPEVLQVSHSRLKMWRRCEMAHHYRYVQRLRKIKPPMALFIGTGIHAMIEAQTKGGSWKGEIAKFRKEYNKLFAEERAELGDIPSELEGIMTSYFEKYKNDGLHFIPRHKGATAEIGIKVDLDNRTRFIGFIDKFPVDDEGRHWVMDHKTCRSIPDEESRFADLQLLMYVWLVPQLGYPKPAGVIWDYIRKKAPSIPEVLKSGAISKAQKIDTTYDVYMATVDRLLPDAPDRDEYVAFAQTLKGKEEKFFRRIYLPVNNQAMVDNVVADVHSTVEQIRSRGATAMVRNMTRDCKQCSYYNLCQAEVRGLDSEFIRKADYIVKEKTDAREEKIEKQQLDAASE